MDIFLLIFCLQNPKPHVAYKVFDSSETAMVALKETKCKNKRLLKLTAILESLDCKETCDLGTCWRDCDKSKGKFIVKEIK